LRQIFTVHRTVKRILRSCCQILLSFIIVKCLTKNKLCDAIILLLVLLLNSPMAHFAKFRTRQQNFHFTILGMQCTLAPCEHYFLSLFLSHYDLRLTYSYLLPLMVQISRGESAADRRTNTSRWKEGPNQKEIIMVAVDTLSTECFVAKEKYRLVSFTSSLECLY
jgi:hypothetical protein